jgi:hypothetical protein
MTTREVGSSGLISNPFRSFRSAIRPTQSVGCLFVVDQTRTCWWCLRTPDDCSVNRAASLTSPNTATLKLTFPCSFVFLQLSSKDRRP